jgi:S-formylglutathione hydrolase FrmB
MCTRLRFFCVFGLPAVILFATLCEASSPVAAAAEWRLGVRFLPAAHSAAYTGRIYVFFTKRRGEPRHGPDWFHPEAFISRDVVNWKPGETFELASDDKEIIAFPKPLKAGDLAGRRAQAVVRFNPYERELGDGPGNGYSQVITIEDKGGEQSKPVLIVDRLVPPRKFVETAVRKEFTVRSPLLSTFFGRDVSLSAAVVLPPGYESEKNRRYPTIFTIPGFGGTHYLGRFNPQPRPSPNGVEFIRVVLDPSCPLGHDVFADSANNGPVGEALVTEFLPAFDRAFRTVADPRARFLTGHSSGGWSSLWLQVTYPDSFAGTWSTSPDPVDFRDFQGIDIYRPGENMYFDRKGEERPLARMEGEVALRFPSFARMEDVLGPGGQLRSFEAVFSPRGSDGKPEMLWDRNTGAIHPDVAHAWEKYDIRLVLERNWPTLGPKLAGKLHVFMGDEDTFYLEGATKLLQKSLAKLGSDAVVEIHPGKSHFTLLDSELSKRIRTEMAAAYRKAFPQDPPTR